MPKQGFTNLTVSRDLYAQLTNLAKSNGNVSIPHFLENQIAGSTVLRTNGVQNESGNHFQEKWRAGWDSNPRFAAPQAAVLVLARLPARRQERSWEVLLAISPRD